MNPPINNINKYEISTKYCLIGTEIGHQSGRPVKILTYKRVYDWKWKVFAILATLFTAGLALKNNKIFWAYKEVVWGETKKKHFTQDICGKHQSTDSQPNLSSGQSALDSTILPSAVLASQSRQPSAIQTAHFFSAYIHAEEYADSLILDDDLIWNQKRAPYLFEDFNMADGTPIPLQAGDYLLKLKLVNSHPELRKNDNLEERTGIYFPGSLIREMKPGQVLTLKYKGELIHITLLESGPPIRYYGGHEAPCPSFQTLIESTEYLLYVKQHGLSSKPVPIKSLETAKHDPFQGKRYEHPALVQRHKQKQANAERVKIQFLGACNKAKEELVHYRFSNANNQFATDDTVDLSAALKQPAIAAWQIASNHLYIELPGETEGIVLSLSETHLLILQNKNLVIPEDCKLVFSSIPEQVIGFIDLKENQLTKQGILDHLKEAQFINGLLVLKLEPYKE